MLRVINQAALDLIKGFESLRLTAYQDVAGIWTIGWGHIKGVRAGMQITEAQAEDALRDDLEIAETFVDGATSDVMTSENQFGAMVSLCFNIGTGNFLTSTVLKQHRLKNYAPAADAFLMWDKAHVDGQLQEVSGLAKRRIMERKLYLTT
jgi:lysozyme